MKPFPRLIKKSLWLLYFFFYIVWELIISNIKVAHDVLTPSVNAQPGVIGVPIRGDTNAEITVLANLISLTPGTLALDISTDRQFLFVHSMFAGDKAALVKSIKQKLEHPILEIMQ